MTDTLFSESLKTLDKYSETDKVWVYKSPTPFNNDQIENIKSDINEFLASWNTHGKKNKASAEILLNQFILFIVEDSSQPSGCSIDSNVQFIKNLESKYNLSLLENDRVYYIENDIIKSSPFSDVKSVVTDDTMIMKPYFDSIKDLRENFFRPAKESVYKRLL